ncbi:MAG: NADH:ubiquinone oxidoreductase [Candidatus Diapherotrites archaeon]|nr:NADH:ubiquinone oxidoreductase [Candidatus Diapherotrites archaeon]
MIFEHAPALIIAFPLLTSFAVPILNRFGEKFRNFFVLLSLLFSLFFVLTLAPQVYSHGVIVYTFGSTSPGITLPSGYSMPIRITFTIDGMSIFMAFIASIVSISGLIYSWGFLKKERVGMDKFYSLLLLMSVGMYGMIFTGDLFNMFVFLEILSIASCALIAFWVHKGETSEAAFKYMVVSSIAALFMLIAVGIFYGQYNALNIAAIASMINYNLLDKIALSLLIVGLAMKAGAVPMHMWVPDAYGQAPAPITMMLVAASQASLYALFRTCFTLFGLRLDVAMVGWIIIILGILSMFVGVTMAIPQKDIKKLMAYHSVSQTGYMLLGVGVGLAVMNDPIAFQTYGMKAMEGSIFHIINYALYKGLLFLTAGAIFYKLKTRNLDEMGGIAHNMPLTTLFFIIGALAIAGIPPLNGFASKFLIYESVYRFNPLLSIIAMVVSVLTLASFVKVFHSAFMGPKMKKNVREAPRAMLLGMAIIAILIIIFSLFPAMVVRTIVDPAVIALANQGNYISAVMGGI